MYAWFVHSTHTFIFLLHKSNNDEIQTLKQCTSNYCSWSMVTIIQEHWI